jgi:hypothetical protein
LAHPDFPVHDPFDCLAKTILGGVLEVEAGIAKPLMLSHLREPALGRRKAVLKGADDDVGACELGPRFGRAAPELLLVKADHCAGDVGANRELSLGGNLAIGSGGAIRAGAYYRALAHMSSTFPALGIKVAREEEDGKEPNKRLLRHQF